MEKVNSGFRIAIEMRSGREGDTLGEGATIAFVMFYFLH